MTTNETPPTISVATKCLVDDHRVHALFPVSFGTGRSDATEASLQKQQRRVETLRVREVVARLRLQNPQPDSELQKPIWSLLQGKGMALDDFYPHVRQILGGKPEGPLLCLPFELDGPFLSQIKGGKKRLWTISLGKAAQERCGCSTVDMQIEGARLFVFRTGVAILDLFWRYDTTHALPADVLLEGNYLLSHGNYGKSPKPSSPHDPSCMSAQVLQDMAQALIPNLGEGATLHSGRRILYTLARLHTPLDEVALRLLAMWMSHRQTADYLPTPEVISAGTLQPFGYLCHALAPEGGASVIFDAGQASEYVNGFVRAGGHNTYVPLFVTSLHTHFWLLNQTEWLPARRKSANSRDEKEGLEELYRQAITFRRYFYFPIVSQISLHNTYYQRCQQVLRMTERLQFLEQTTRDVAELIKAKRTRWLGLVSGAVGGFLVSNALLQALSNSGWLGPPDLREWLAITAHANAPVLARMVDEVVRWEHIVFLGSLIFGLVGLFVGWQWGISRQKD